MPYINSKISVELSDEKEAAIKAKLGKAIALIPGKSEAYLMLNFQDNCRMYFGGKNDSPIAMIEVKLFGSAGKKDYDILTKEICSIFNEELNIPPNNIYVKYDEVENWGWNGHNF